MRDDEMEKELLEQLKNNNIALKSVLYKILDPEGWVGTRIIISGLIEKNEEMISEAEGE